MKDDDIKPSSKVFQGIVEMLAALMEAPVSPQDIHRITGLGKTTIYRYIKTLHDRRIIYISTWETKVFGGYYFPKYMFNFSGNTPDAVCPEPLSEKELARRVRKKQEIYVRPQSNNLGSNT